TDEALSYVVRISKVASLLALAPDVAIRLFRYPQAPHFILCMKKSYLPLYKLFILGSISRI
ncbi:hypothetical protein, partial [Virgibacillus pantothenticus]|uniref:hypothetical protein n=1 Tax=Virgibacillus pantothenticus TaxID=1473 RepID=UPI0025B09D64